MKIVYIAGPYTASTPWQVAENIRAAEIAGKAIAELGAAPLIPHSNTGQRFIGIMTPAYWYAATLTLLRKCDAVLMLPNWRTSVGATRERDEAEELGIPVFDTIEALAGWLGTEYHDKEEVRGVEPCGLPREWCTCPPF